MYLSNDERVVMKVNDLYTAFHMPPAILPKINKETGEEVAQPLPPGAPRFVFPVEEYPGCPSNWMHGSSKASSYWLPVRSGCGMWLDFNYNYSHSHHVAAVVSIQGVNPITGQATKQLHLEQYRERCPVHDAPFGQDRFCEQCNYKWDGQNYISSNSTPRGLFWIDGFRHADGVVRQYIFTKESCKGVATQVIGEDRVFAIGIALYLSKEPKKVAALPEQNTWKLGSNQPKARFASAGGHYLNSSPKILKGFPPSHTVSPGVRLSDQDLAFTPKSTDENFWLPQAAPIPSEIKCTMPTGGAACAGGMADTTLDFDPVEYSKSSPSDINNEVQIKTPEEIEQEMEKLEITAGAKIKQRIYLDPEEPGFWQDEPAGMIYINYCTIEDAEKIMAAGHKKREGSFLSTLEF